MHFILLAIYRRLVRIEARQVALHITQNRILRKMATEAEALNELSVKVDDLIADVRAALVVISGPDNTLGPDGQAALDGLVAKIDSFDAEITPPVTTPPTDGSPAQPVR